MERAESTHLNEELIQPGQEREPYWWLNESSERNLLKMEVEKELQEKFLKEEFEATFYEENKDESVATIETAEGAFPIDLHPGFDLQCVIQVKCCYLIMYKWAKR